MPRRTLTVRNIPDDQLKRLRARAESNHRSLNGELLVILADASLPEPRPPAALPLVREATLREYTAAPKAPKRERALADTVDRKALAAICRRYGIRWLALFGSHASGTARADSDVDVIVDFEPGKTPGFGIVRVADALRTTFGGRRVDLVTRNGLSPRMREQVLAGAVPLYGA